MKKYNLLILGLLIILFTFNAVGTKPGTTPDSRHREASPDSFVSSLTDAINEAIADIYHIKITLIENDIPFMWYYRNQDLVFNEGTFNYISRRVYPGDAAGMAKLSSAAGFPNAYSQVITAIKYSLGSTDNNKLEEAQFRASAQANRIVADYQEGFGIISEEAMKAAALIFGEWVVSTKFDYIITVILGSQWSGRGDKQPLTYTEMANARNLRSLLPEAPGNEYADMVINDVSRYLDMMKSVNTLLDQLQLGSWSIAQLKNHTKFPSDANGGMKTVDPTTGKVSREFNVGYAIERKLQDLQEDLYDPKRIIKVEIPFPGNSPANRFTIEGSGSEISVGFEYQGYSMVPAAPTGWRHQANTGWYAADPIADAYKNGKQDISGFKFIACPGYDLKPLEDGGNFGFITNLFICNKAPTITIHYKDGYFERFKRSWDRMASEEILSLCGIKVGGSNYWKYRCNLQPGPSNREFSVVFTPSQPEVRGSLLQSTAYVIGAAFRFPATAAG